MHGFRIERAAESNHRGPATSQVAGLLRHRDSGRPRSLDADQRMTWDALSPSRDGTVRPNTHTVASGHGRVNGRRDLHPAVCDVSILPGGLTSKQFGTNYTSGPTSICRKSSCGNGADWNGTLTIWEWVKLIATALAISTALGVGVVGATWLIAGY
jgi:hypothetical protein